MGGGGQFSLRKPETLADSSTSWGELFALQKDASFAEGDPHTPLAPHTPPGALSSPALDVGEAVGTVQTGCASSCPALSGHFPPSEARGWRDLSRGLGWGQA